MSNLVETLLDRLIFPSLSGKESPLPKNLSGSQNLVDNSVKMDSALMSEFHQMLNSDSYAPHYPTMNAFSGVKNINPYFDTSNSLVSRVSKLFLPSLVPLQDLHLSTQAEYLLTHESYYNTRPGSILSEIIIDQIDLFVNKGYNNNVKTPQKAKDMPCAPEVPPVVISKQIADVPSSDTMTLQKVPAKPKPPVDNSQIIMNQEFVNRKAKKMNKQSKKRRRRQKKSRAKTTSGVSEEPQPSDRENVKRIDADRGSDSAGVGRDIFCDIISVSGPDVTSFVISVESTVDDDTDWDVCSDSDWLNDCSEFEVTGLFVGNLTAPTFGSCPVKKVSSPRLEVPQEDKETLKLKNLLLSVNKAWEESTRDLTKPRLLSKVSFAPDQDLVEVHEVDNYDRKGEWEIYALERIRFKKKIDELESVISPCLKEEHREKVFENLQKSNL